MMDVLKLADEVAVKVEIGPGVEFVVEDPWALDATFTRMFVKAGEENDRRTAEETAQSKPRGERVMEYDVYEQIRQYVQATYSVEISLAIAIALHMTIQRTIAKKKANWLDNFKLNAS